MPTIQYYIHQLRVLPLGEVVRRATDVGKRISRDRIEKTKSILFGTGISDREFFDRAFGGARDANSVLARFRQRFFFFTDTNNLKEVLPLLPEAEKKKILSSAEKSCEHRFDLLGSGEIGLGPRIDWHRDFKTGYAWKPKTWYRDVAIPYGKADIKVPWELSRFSHAITLGQAYRLTSNEEYTREFMLQVGSWIDENQPRFGVNWACTMDVAIRACNWIAGFALLRNSPSLTDEFLFKFLKSLFVHGVHIRDNLEYSEALTSNHYLSNITGLIYLAVLFPDSDDAAGWLRFGIGELKQEMEKQVYSDGCDFEASTCYHRLVLELFFFSALVTVVNDPGFKEDNFRESADRIFGREFTGRLHLMFKAVLHLLKPNGMMPQIGDNDSGRLHVFAQREVLDMRYMLSLGAVFFRDQAFKIKEFGFAEEALWVFGSSASSIWRALPEQALAYIPSSAFPDAGWFVMRQNRDYMIISCGPNGQNGNGGHAHNDKLSFEIFIDGQDAIVDPGMYLYTPDPVSRNEYRSTGVHNTVSVDGQEQNDFIASPRVLFTMKNMASAEAIGWEVHGDMDRFVGEHSGFTRLSGRVLHRREILFHRKARTWEIIDTFSGSGRHEIAWNLTLAPGTNVAVRSEDLQWIAEKGRYSPAYGIEKPTTRLRATITTELPCARSFTITKGGSPS